MKQSRTKGIQRRTNRMANRPGDGEINHIVPIGTRSVSSLDDKTKLVDLVTYHDCAEYIERMAQYSLKMIQK